MIQTGTNKLIKFEEITLMGIIPLGMAIKTAENVNYILCISMYCK